MHMYVYMCRYYVYMNLYTFLHMFVYMCKCMYVCNMTNVSKFLIAALSILLVGVLPNSL